MNLHKFLIVQKAATALKWLTVILVSGLIAGGAVFTYWLHTDNDRLEEEKTRLEVRKQELESQLVDVQANSAYLKDQALKNNVFLEDLPQVR